MPDPLLTLKAFARAFQQARCMAERLGVTLSRDGELVFFEPTDRQGVNLLGRIDCTGYPMHPPDVQFLHPSSRDRRTAPPSKNRLHWPAKPPPMERHGTLHMCIAGTKSYLLWHADPGRVIDLSSLVVTLAWGCGQAQKRPGAAHRR